MSAAIRLGINGRFHGAPITGVQRFAHEVAGRLLRLCDATLFLPSGVADPHDLPGVTRVVRGRLGGHAFEQLELPRLARRAGCSVVLHLAGTAPMAARGDVIVIHDVLPLTQPRWFTPRFCAWRRLVLGRTVPRAARIITVTAWSANEIARTLGVDRQRIVVTPQGLAPFDRPAPAHQVRAARARYGLGAPYLLAVGAGDPRKNHAFLGEVLRRWRASGESPPPLVVVGSPAKRLFACTADWTGGLDVRALGHVDDATLHALYTGATALCYPSVAEGYGRPPLEALACGTPAIVADYPCAAEVLDGGACILPLDADAWVRALRTLVTSQDSAGTTSSADDAGGTGVPRRAAASGRGDATDAWDEAATIVMGACEAAHLEGRRGRWS